MTFSAEVYLTRLVRARKALLEAGVDALFITPGADLAYLTGYHAKALERLTCLVVRADADPVMIVPGLEVPAAKASPLGGLGVPIQGWAETEDATAIVARLTGTAQQVGLDDHMWARQALRFQSALPQTRWLTAGEIVQPLRVRKDEAEVAALLRAGDAIDRVHAQMPTLLRAGRSEREIGRDIADLMLSAGHASIDFIIVASGPNSASPHHDVSDRVLQPGDVVVVDIGGTMPDGYCSDSTRTYAIEWVDAEFAEMYDVLQEAQAAACAAVRPGISCEHIDATAREHLAAAGLGEAFIHRTGHGIGLETHEEPYIVSGNARPLEPGMAFSIEPGFYLADRFGARIEDIVVCTADGMSSMNHQPRELVVVGEG